MALLAGLTTLSARANPTASDYHAYVLQPLPGHDYAGPTVLDRTFNRAGQSVGFSGLSSRPYDSNRATLFSPLGVPTDLGAPVMSSAAALNEAGEVVIQGPGVFGQVQRCYRWKEGVLTELPLVADASQGVVSDINTSGQVVGKCVVRGVSTAVVWSTDNVLRDLGPRTDTATSINDRGEVVGFSTNMGGLFLWSPEAPEDGITTIQFPGTGNSTSPRITEDGRILLNKGGLAWEWTRDSDWRMLGMGQVANTTGTRLGSYSPPFSTGQATRNGVPLPLPEGATGSQAWAANDEGVVVGSAYGPSPLIAYGMVWFPGDTYLALDDPLTLYDISESGELLGAYGDVFKVVLSTPSFTVASPTVDRAGVQAITPFVTSAQKPLGVTYALIGNDNPSLFSPLPALSEDGKTLTLSARQGASGTAHLTIEATNGGPGGPTYQQECTVVVDTTQTPPTANPGGNNGVYTVTPAHSDVTTTVNLNGSGSQLLGHPLSYQWQATDGGPAPSNPTSAATTLSLTPNGATQTYGYRFTATDSVTGLATSVNAQVSLGARQNRAPVANAGPNQSVRSTGTGVAVTLDGSGSSDPDGDALTYLWKDGNTVLTGATTSRPTVTLTNGTHAVTLQVTDPYGLSSGTSSVSVTVVPAPTANAGGPYILTPTHTKPNPPTTVAGTLRGTGTAPAGHPATYCWTAVTGGVPVPVPATSLITCVTVPVPAAQTVNTYRLTVKDSATGLTTTSDATVVINPVPNAVPVANAGSSQTVNAAGATTPVTLNGTGSTDGDGDTLTYKWCENNVQLATGATPTVSLSTGIHTLSLKVTDTYGAVSTNPATVTLTVAPPPVLSGVTATGITSTSAVITWTTDVAADGTVEYGVTTSLGSRVSASALVTSHSLALAGLTPATQYRYKVSSKGANGATVCSALLTFITAPAPPAILNISVTSRPDFVDVSWVTSVPATGSVEYGSTTGYGFAVSDPAPGVNHVVRLTGGLASGNTYHFRVRSTTVGGTAAGGAEAVSPDSTFTTPAAAPVILNGGIVYLTDQQRHSLTLTWTTDVPSNSSVDYGLDTSYGKTVTDPANVTEHRVVLTNLAEGTLYHINVRSLLAGGSALRGQEVSSGDLPYPTLDRAPTITSGPTHTLGLDGKVTIRWTTDLPTSGRVLLWGNFSGEFYDVYDTNPSTTDHVVTVTLNPLPTDPTLPNFYPYIVESTNSGGLVSAQNNFVFAQAPGTGWSITPTVHDGGRLELTVNYQNDTGAPVPNLRVTNVRVSYEGSAVAGALSAYPVLGTVAPGATASGQMELGYFGPNFTPVVVTLDWASDTDHGQVEIPVWVFIANGV